LTEVTGSLIDVLAEVLMGTLCKLMVVRSALCRSWEGIAGTLRD